MQDSGFCVLGTVYWVLGTEYSQTEAIMLNKLYLGLGVGILLLYGTTWLMGWDFGPRFGSLHGPPAPRSSAGGGGRAVWFPGGFGGGK